MNPNNLRVRAERFRALHQAPPILLLPNAWDVVSAMLYEKEGFPAVATTSAGVASAFGYPDGQKMALEEQLAVFVPDLGDLDEQTLSILVREIEAPLNVIAGTTTPPVARLEKLGVARVSFGPRPMRAVLSLLREIAREWTEGGTFEKMSESTLSYEELNGWFEDSPTL